MPSRIFTCRGASVDFPKQSVTEYETRTIFLAFQRSMNKANFKKIERMLDGNPKNTGTHQGFETGLQFLHYSTDYD